MFTIPDVVECTLELMGNVILVTVVWSTWFVSPLSFVSIDELYVDFVSSKVDGTRYFPSPWFNLLVRLCAVLPLRFERVEAADVLLLFREHRREPLFKICFFLSFYWKKWRRKNEIFYKQLIRSRNTNNIVHNKHSDYIELNVGRESKAG